MLDFSAPTFSLGLDLDLDPCIADLPTDGEPEEDHGQVRDEDDGAPNFELLADREPPSQLDMEEEESVPVGDSDFRPIQDPHLRPFKRLRRGLESPAPTRPSLASSAARDDGIDAKGTPTTGFVIVDDDIEEFSSQEEPANRDCSSSVRSSLTCSSSKFSLLNNGVSTGRSANKRKAPKVTPASNFSTSNYFGNSSSKNCFPKLTISPLRKIHLLDSDSDDSFINDDIKCKADVFKRTENTVNNQKQSFESRRVQDYSLLKDISPKKNINMATPALDEFCENYFRSLKESNVGKSKEESSSFCSSRVLDANNFPDEFECYTQKKSVNIKPQHCGDLFKFQPPAYQYFYHSDGNICTLVRERLRFFTPLGTETFREQMLPAEENINYMSQFGHENGRSQARKTRKQTNEGNSKKGKNQSSGGRWVSTKNSAAIAKDAGKRRVHAESQKSGHWFTGDDGRKVYVNKNGQELTGQIAYRQYKKESGGGSRRSKKKPATRKKKK